MNRTLAFLIVLTSSAYPAACADSLDVARTPELAEPSPAPGPAPGDTQSDPSPEAPPTGGSGPAAAGPPEGGADIVEGITPGEAVPPQLQDLEQQIQEQEEEIARLEAQIAVAQLQTPEQRRIDEFRIQQENELLRIELHALQEQIRRQQQVLASRARQLQTTVAPATSDLRLYLESQVQEAQDRLAALESQYFQLLESQRTAIQRRAQSEISRMESEQEELIELTLAHAEAQRELRELRQEHEKQRENLAESPATQAGEESAQEAQG